MIDIPKVARNELFNMSTDDLYSLASDCERLKKKIDCELTLRGD